MNDWPQVILLDSPEECERELMRVTNGLAHLDHVYTLAVDAKDEAEQTWEEYEAVAAAAVHEKGLTATVLQGRITSWCAEHPDAMAAKKAARSTASDLKKVDRYFRSLEQRATNAQAAMKRHLGNAKYGGTV